MRQTLEGLGKLDRAGIFIHRHFLADLRYTDNMMLFATTTDAMQQKLEFVKAISEELWTIQE